MRLRVLIDVDDVVGQFRFAYVLLVNLVLGEAKYTLESTYEHWDVDKNVTLTKHQQALIWKRINADDFHEFMKPVDGAVEAIHRIAHKYDIAFLTKPLKTSKTWTYDRKRWLRKHLGPKLGSQVIGTALKPWVDGDVFIDDRTDSVRGWLEDRNARNPYRDHLGVVFAWPYNEIPPTPSPRLPSILPTYYYPMVDELRPDPHRGLIRVHGWKKIVELLGC